MNTVIDIQEYQTQQAYRLLEELRASKLSEGDSTIERFRKQYSDLRTHTQRFLILGGATTSTLVALLFLMVTQGWLDFSIAAAVSAFAMVGTLVMFGRRLDELQARQPELLKKIRPAGVHYYSRLHRHQDLSEIQGYLQEVYASGRTELTLYEAQTLEAVADKLKPTTEATRLRVFVLNQALAHR